jgi:hypothetical protein
MWVWGVIILGGFVAWLCRHCGNEQKSVEEIYQELENICRRRGTSMPEVLRNAVAMEKWLEESRIQGERK